MSESTIPRMTGILVIEVNESNPNGDPDRESDPRTLPGSRIGIISAVSFKRKLRDLVHEKDGAVWKHVKAEFDPELADEHFDILENRGLQRSDVNALLKGAKGENRREGNYREFHERFWDARVFGNTFLESSDDEEKSADEQQKANLRNSVRNGVVQFVNAHSVCPVEIRRDTNTKKSGAQEDKDRGMAPLGDRRVLHGVYVMPFFVNPALAHRTHCSKTDVDLLLKLLVPAYPSTVSRARPFVEVRHAFVMEHRSPLGSCSDFDLVRHFTPRRRDGKNDEPSHSWDQYEVYPDLGPHEGRVTGFRDLAKFE
ncbi:MAG TPA: type I CRISPR-associated protein Cas7 [Fimbriimonadaceae bacterium]|nr:type I CRISPR-associated protein Cas7 [Fimbriimonadaceae bacterium]